MLKIKELRTEKNFTQKQIGEIINCNQSAIGKYERGELEPTLSNLVKLADFFGVTTDYLLGREDDFGVISATKITSPALSDDERELLAAFKKLNHDKRQQVIGFALACAI